MNSTAPKQAPVLMLSPREYLHLPQPSQATNIGWFLPNKKTVRKRREPLSKDFEDIFTHDRTPAKMGIARPECLLIAGNWPDSPMPGGLSASFPLPSRGRPANANHPVSHFFKKGRITKSGRNRRKIDLFGPEIGSTRKHAGKRSIAWTAEQLRRYDASLISTNRDCIDYQQLAECLPPVVDTRNSMNDMAFKSRQLWKEAQAANLTK